MKKLYIVIIASIFCNKALGQCGSLFSFAAYFETVTFHNQSNISNARHYWNFGDGSSSYLKNPTHKFPETGNYMVTLFSKDTLTNCSSFYEFWINVTKYSTDSCQTNISDSVFVFNGGDWVKIIDHSSNCNNYHPTYDCAGSHNASQGNWLGISSWQHGRFISRVKYTTNDTINGYVVQREAYQSLPYKYSSTKNYTSCSANFEFTVVSENVMGQRILFKAMNNSASFYEWQIIGFGNPIYSNHDTISHFYPYNYSDLALIGLNTIGLSGCKDTLWQQVLVRGGLKTYVGIQENPPNSKIKIYPNPTNSILNIIDEQNHLENQTVEIRNTLGQIVLSIPFSNTIDLSSLQTGMYFLVIQNKSNIITEKIIKQ